MKKNFLITGGAGFIGSHLAEELSKKNRVVVIDNLSQGNKLLLNKNIEVVIGDVRDINLLRRYSKGINSIFHFAAIIGVDIVSKSKIENMDVEFDGIKNICKIAEQFKIKKIIYSSTSGVYGKLNYSNKVDEESIVAPVSGYAIAKRACEIYLKNFQKKTGFNCAAIRLFNVYGKKQDKRMVIPRFVYNAKKNSVIKIYGDGKQTRDFTYIDDCIRSFILLEEKIKGYEIFNLSKGDQTSIKNLAIKIKKLFNSKSNLKLIKVPKDLEEYQVNKRCGDSNKLFKYINFKPETKLIDGLKKIYF